VVKLGGAELPWADRLWPELRALDGPFVLVHGGGAAITQASAGTTFVGGRRVSDARTAEVAAQTLRRLGEALVAAGRAQGLPLVHVQGGADHGLPLARLDPDRLGHVGRPAALCAGPLTAALARGHPAVVSPPGRGAAGEWLNVNADDMAAFLAAALRAPLLLFTDVPGVMVEGAVRRRLSLDDGRQLVRTGVAQGGMAAKLEAAAAAVATGAPYAWIGPLTPDRPLAVALAGTAGTRIVA
jgi:acetylglutamate kinase